MPGPWEKYGSKAPSGPWERYGAASEPNNGPAPVMSTDPSGRTPTGEPAEGDTRNAAQRYLDNLVTPDPRREEWQSPTKNALDDVFRHSAQAFVPLISHPLQSVASMASGAGKAFATNPGNPLGVISDMFVKPLVDQMVGEYQEKGPARAAANLLGIGMGTLASGELGNEALRTIPKMGGALRLAAVGDPDAAALRGLRVGPASPKALSTIRATQGARPFLQGAQSLEDVQARIPTAKAEIWGPYQQAIDAIGDKPVTGPDGPTTVRELESERRQLSALNRQLKSKAPNPEAVQLAQQKGMNQAQLLNRERAVQNALDPVLRDAGLQPKAIRQAFGQVSQVGERVSGKSTLAEPKKPYGFGKMANLSLEHPFQAPAQILSGMRDIVAGRPLWSGSPTDVSLREAFRPSAMKPEFGAFSPETLIPKGTGPRMLEANVPGNAPFGEEPYPGNMSGIPERNPTRITPPPVSPRGLLPPIASEGEPKPMFRFAHPYQEPFDPHFHPVDLKDYAKFRPKAK